MKKIYVLFTLIVTLALSIGCCGNHTVHLEDSNNKLTVSSLPNHLKSSTVELMSDAYSDNYQTYCAGVWINETDILTAKHCTESPITHESTVGTQIKFRIYKDYINHFPAEVDERLLNTAVLVAFNHEKDLAVLRSIDDIDHGIAHVRSLQIPDGEKVLIVGHPARMEYTIMEGMVSASRPMIVDEFNLQALHITSQIWFGNSGGGAFLSNTGELVGICSFMLKRLPGGSFFVHANEIRKFLDKNDINYFLK